MVALVLVTIAAGPPPKTLGDDASDLPAGGVTFYEDDNGDVVYETFENGEIEVSLTEDEFVVSEEPNGDITLAHHSGWACSVYASNPWQSSSYIRGYGYISCSGPDVLQTRLRVTIQKHSWGSVWNNLSQRSSGWQYANLILS